MEAAPARYKLLRQLGSGGMGVVYEAEDRERGIALAVKRTRRGAGTDLLLFKREFRTAAELSHPNLVRLHDLVADDTGWWFSMERVEGGNLAEWIGLRRPSEASAAPATWTSRSLEDADSGHAASESAGLRAAACRIDRLLACLPQIVDALEYLHAHGVVHRDLKLANVLVETSGTVKLVDFGIARALDDGSTGIGELAGTLSSMAPEQAAGLPAGPPADVYALGCTLFEALTGETVFAGSAPHVIMAHQVVPPRRVESVVLGVPVGLATAIDAMLAKEPGARPTPAQIRAMLGLERLGPPPDAWRGHAFVGRAAEVEAIERALATPGLVLVTGPSGSGKTALLDEIGRRIRARGEAIHRGRAYPNESVPFRAFDRVVDQLAAAIRRLPSAWRRAMDEDLVRAGAVFPVLLAARWEPDAPAPRETEPRARRQQAFTALATLLERSFELQPTVVIIDDLQWADADSLELLRFLLDTPLRAVASWRGGPDRPAAALRSHPRMVSVALQPLAEADAACLIRELAAGAPADAVAEAVRRADGSPLFAAELGRVLAEGGGIGELSLSELVIRRTVALPPDSRRIVAVAAVVGKVAPKALLHAAAGLPADACGAALDAAMAAGVLRRSAEGEDGILAFEFAHDRFREGVLDGLATDQRRQFHAAVATAVEAGAWAPSVEGARLETLLSHWRAADDAGRVARYLPLAAEEATRQLAFDRAAALYRERLELAAPEEAPAVRLRLAEVLEYTGAYAEAAALLAGEPARDPQLAEAIAMRRGTALVKIGRIAEGTAILEPLALAAGVRISRSATARIARLAVLSGVAAVLARLPRRWFRSAITPGRRAKMEIYRELVESFALADPLASGESALRHQILALVSDDDEARVAALLMGSVGRIVIDPSPRRLRRAAQDLDRAASLGSAGRSLAVDFYVAFGRAVVAMYGGDVQEGREHLERAMRDIERQGTQHRWEAVACRSLLMSACLELGDHARLDELVARTAAERGDDLMRRAVGRCHHVLVRVRQGRQAEAEAVMTEWRATPVEPSTRLAFFQEMSAMSIDLAREDDEALLDRWRRLTPDMTRRGQLTDPHTFVGWHLPALEAAAVVDAKGALPPAEVRAARKLATVLLRRASPAHRAMALRARALLGGPRDQERAIAEALACSRRYPLPWSRWLCLHSAKRLGATGHEAEIAELARSFGYALVPRV